jgi:hypothetical protein
MLREFGEEPKNMVFPQKLAATIKFGSIHCIKPLIAKYNPLDISSKYQ